ncbi:MAG: alpha/beta hydrolase [Cyclobacteriaceae bacterium]|nr:alpha/beta hydrolase [Cyclobacteriaceae bacterium]
MLINIKEKGEYRYIDEGNGEILLLLHGLFGALSNWEHVVNHFSKNYRVVIPLLPIYEMPVKQSGMELLTEFLQGFIKELEIKEMHLIGNSLGGHIALIYTLRKQETVKSLTLTGSSGLFENSMGGSFPRRGSYDYIKERVEYTFYDPATATKELVDEVFETTKSIPKCLRIVAIAKSAQRHNMAEEIPNIKVPTFLIWGLNDTITPPHVGHEFNRLIPNSTLRFVDKCCHAPMMEHPEYFNILLEDFLNTIKK